MNNLEELQKTYVETANKLSELGEKIKALKEWPRNGDEYWLWDFSELDVFIVTFGNDYIDKNRIRIGNFHRTEEEAKKWGERWTLKMELEAFSDGPGEYSVFHNGIKWVIANFNIGEILFKTKERAKEAIEHFGDRLNILKPNN